MKDFAQLLHSEWTKFRTVRGWLIGVVAAALAMVLLGMFSATGSSVRASGGGGGSRPSIPTGPGGEAVTDNFSFVHQALAGDGSITVRLLSVTGVVISDNGTASGIEPWTKAGVIIKASTSPGSAYAAVLLTGANGVRMQSNFTGDIAGSPTPSTSARWLRLVRAGSTFTGYESADGSTWTRIGTTKLSGMPSTVQAGIFVTSPPHYVYRQVVGGGIGNMSMTRATGVFDHVSLDSGQPSGTWQQGNVGDNRDGGTQDGDTFTLQGSGDIAPIVDAGPGAVERTLVGTFGTLTILTVLAVLFMTTEYRRGMIRTTFAANPRRGRVLAAKAVVIGAVSFVASLVAAAITLPLARYMLEHGGNIMLPVSTPVEIRLIVGTAALIAVAAIFALALGTILRRSVGAVAAIVVLIVLPYILTSAAILPAVPAEWMLRLTPAAAFAVQQSIPAYAQVTAAYLPSLGFYPLSPLGGFAVLCAYAAAALALATHLLRRRDV